MSAQKKHKKKAYQLPKASWLKEEVAHPEFDRDEILEKKNRIEAAFQEFGIEGTVKNYFPGPVITTYEFFPKPQIKTGNVLNSAEAVACRLGGESVRIQRIPGKSFFSVEIPNNRREVIRLSKILESRAFCNSPSKFSFAMGKTTRGEVYMADLANMPHLFVAGDTGSGKSVFLHTLIASMLFKASPSELKLILIDPKRFEFSHYNYIPHLLIPVIHNARKAIAVLKEAVKIMEERYVLLGHHNVRNIEQYNKQVASKGRRKDHNPLPYIVIIVDELASLSLISGQEIEFSIARLALLAKPAGIHLVLATLRLSIDVINGTIKNNFPCRIAFRVRSKIDSRLILDTEGAERLLGMGDMLFIPPGSVRPIRLHGPYISVAEIHRLVNHVKNQAVPSYSERLCGILQEIDRLYDYDIEKDEFYDRAVHLILNAGSASASFLQQRLKIGFSRAARIIDTMEMEGLISPSEGSKPREILVGAKEYFRGKTFQKS